MSLVRFAAVGCLLLTVGFSGCGGEASTGNQQGVPDAKQPDAGNAAAKSIMNMQPPAPGKKAKH